VSLIRIQHPTAASYDLDRRAKDNATANRDFFADGFSTNGQIFAGTNFAPSPPPRSFNGFKRKDSKLLP